MGSSRYASIASIKSVLKSSWWHRHLAGAANRLEAFATKGGGHGGPPHHSFHVLRVDQGPRRNCSETAGGGCSAGLSSPAAKASAAREFWQRVVKRVPLFRHHPHPMVVHFPIVFMISAPVFTLLSLVTGVKSFEVTGFHCLGGGMLFTPVALVTGWFTRWLNYESRWLKPVVVKLVLSPVLLLVGVVALVWRYQNPEILARWGEAPGLLYLALICALIPLVGAIGAHGAELTFPVHHE